MGTPDTAAKVTRRPEGVKKNEKWRMKNEKLSDTMSATKWRATRIRYCRAEKRAASRRNEGSFPSPPTANMSEKEFPQTPDNTHSVLLVIVDHEESSSADGCTINLPGEQTRHENLRIHHRSRHPAQMPRFLLRVVPQADLFDALNRLRKVSRLFVLDEHLVWAGLSSLNLTEDRF